MFRWLPLLAVALTLSGIGESAEATRPGSTGMHAHPGHGISRPGHGISRPGLPGRSFGHPGHAQRFGHGHPRSHGRVHGNIILALPLLFVHPAYSEPYPVERAPTLYVERATIEEIHQRPERTYFCPNYGYYPGVQDCPTGWMLIMPAEPAQ